ncbi:MAG: cation diffusion facilitator family transporter, partial [Anaerolineae bacterium]|nr:cation diffusion facilitator family transporter [Anaerolineae bacterium]
MADGFHSLVDALSNVVALAAQGMAARPPDDDHPYGHRRFEALATLMIGGFLLLVAWEVLQAAVGRLQAGTAPQVLPLSFAVLLATLVINLGVARYETARGHALNSRILLADARQTSVDVVVTCSVLLSLALTQAGLGWVDGLVALLIVLLIGRTGW